jgi:hydrogenase expression/formation protein HypD
LPDNVRLIHGPGLPGVRAAERAPASGHRSGGRRERVILCSYGDLLRVPGAQGDTLLKAKARGADVRMVYSISDALDIAPRPARPPHRVFRHRFRDHHPADRRRYPASRAGRDWAISACTATTFSPPRPCGRFWRRIPRCNWTAASAPPTSAPSSVASPINSSPTDHHRPLVIAGFEPLDVLQAISMLIRQINGGKAEVENEYTRAVNAEGNQKAQRLMAEVFELRSTFEWRGLGWLPDSALGDSAGIRRVGRRAPASPSPRSGPPTIKPAPAVKCCGASSTRRTARYSAPPARPITRSVPAWCPPKALARPIITTVAFRQAAAS